MLRKRSFSEHPRDGAGVTAPVIFSDKWQLFRRLVTLFREPECPSGIRNVPGRGLMVSLSHCTLIRAETANASNSAEARIAPTHCLDSPHSWAIRSIFVATRGPAVTTGSVRREQIAEPVVSDCLGITTAARRVRARKVRFSLVKGGFRATRYECGSSVRRREYTHNGVARSAAADRRAGDAQPGSGGGVEFRSHLLRQHLTDPAEIVTDPLDVEQRRQPLLCPIDRWGHLPHGQPMTAQSVSVLVWAHLSGRAPLRTTLTVCSMRPTSGATPTSTPPTTSAAPRPAPATTRPSTILQRLSTSRGTARRADDGTGGVVTAPAGMPESVSAADTVTLVRARPVRRTCTSLRTRYAVLPAAVVPLSKRLPARTEDRPCPRRSRP
jgi:hypothetical protein